MNNKKYNNIPTKIDKHKDGSYLYPDRNSFEDALIKYADKHGLDSKQLVKDIKSKDNISYKKFMQKMNNKKTTK